jgi:hypothetical protein
MKPRRPRPPPKTDPITFYRSREAIKAKIGLYDVRHGDTPIGQVYPNGPLDYGPGWIAESPSGFWRANFKTRRAAAAWLVSEAIGLKLIAP